MDRWYLYMDESGNFERRRREDLFVLAMLVPADEQKSLDKRYRQLKARHRAPDKVHACKQFRDGWFPDFMEDTVRLALESNALFFCMRHEADLNVGACGSLDEDFAANRYLLMSQGLIEHILFMHEPFLGKDLALALHPNSRVFPVQAEKDRLARLAALGYSYISPREWDDKIWEPDKCPVRLVNVWSQDALRVFADRLVVEYGACLGKTGERHIEAVSLQTASRTGMVFPEFVDVIAWALRRWNKCRQFDELSRHLAADISYGPGYRLYRESMQRYLAGDAAGFISLGLKLQPDLKGTMRECLTRMLLRSFRELGPLDIGAIRRLEAEADDSLRRSLGNWKYVGTLVNTLIVRLRNLPAEQRNTPDTSRILFRLLNHRLSVQNHRGEALPARQTAAEAEALLPRLLSVSVDDWRNEAEFRNRMAVAAANVFDFGKCEAALVRFLEPLEESRRLMSEALGGMVSDPLIGKLSGTLGQDLAFRAPHDPDLFPLSEDLFLKARKHFSRPSDILRQDSYLFHLYLDWGRSEDAKDRLDLVLGDPSVVAFLSNPGPDTAPGTQFALHCLLKYSVEHDREEWDVLLRTYSPENLSNWYGPAGGEHPFELIHLCLGRMAYSLGRSPLARRHLELALRVPVGAATGTQTTLEAIRVQILAWQALEELLREPARAGDLMAKALEELRRLGSTPGLEAILSLNGDTAIGGWFAEAFNQVQAVDWNGRFAREACETLLHRFTFNYR